MICGKCFLFFTPFLQTLESWYMWSGVSQTRPSDTDNEAMLKVREMFNKKLEKLLTCFMPPPHDQLIKIQTLQIFIQTGLITYHLIYLLFFNSLLDSNLNVTLIHLHLCEVYVTLHCLSPCLLLGGVLRSVILHRLEWSDTFIVWLSAELFGQGSPLYKSQHECTKL